MAVIPGVGFSLLQTACATPGRQRLREVPVQLLRESGRMGGSSYRLRSSAARMYRRMREGPMGSGRAR